jgi:hypothetical protein
MKVGKEDIFSAKISKEQRLESLVKIIAMWLAQSDPGKCSRR